MLIFLFLARESGSIGIFPTSSPRTPKTALLPGPAISWLLHPRGWPTHICPWNGLLPSHPGPVYIGGSTSNPISPSSDKPTSCPFLGEPTHPARPDFSPLFIELLVFTEHTVDLKLFTVLIDLAVCAIPSVSPPCPSGQDWLGPTLLGTFPRAQQRVNSGFACLGELVSDVVCCLECAY